MVSQLIVPNNYSRKVWMRMTRTFGIVYGRITNTIITLQILKLILNRRLNVILWIPYLYILISKQTFHSLTMNLCCWLWMYFTPLPLWPVQEGRGIESWWGWDSSVSQPYNMVLESRTNGRPVCSLKDWPEHPALCVCVYIHAWMEHN